MPRVARAGRRTVAGPLLAVALAVTACGGDLGSVAPTPEPSVDPIVATFEVAGGERFKVLLTHADDVTTARQLDAGMDVPGIPNGRILQETGVNLGYSWSLDPEDITFDSETTEDCDGLPSELESGTHVGDRYCPWSAVVVAIDPVP